MADIPNGRCGRCVWFNRLDAAGGECRKEPPKGWVVGQTASWGWPKCDDLDWCGCYQEGALR